MFFDNFLALCDSKNVAPTKAVIDAGLPKSSWSYWKKKYEQGEDPKPSSDNASRLAQYFAVTVDYLLTGEQKKIRPSSRKAKLMQQWSGLEKSLNLCRQRNAKR